MVSIVFEFYSLLGWLISLNVTFLRDTDIQIDISLFSWLCNILLENITQCMYSSVDEHFGCF